MKNKYCSYTSILIIGVLSASFASAQNNLSKIITIEKMRQQTFGSVLKVISQKADFTFAYNNKTVPADSLISVEDYHGTIYSFLNTVLGDQYDYKDVPGYIVLRHAPNTMDLNAHIDQSDGGSILVRGHVTDTKNSAPISNVSVYEPKLLVSTLTNERGDFELKINSGKEEILLTASREAYRDTSLYLLPGVKVSTNSAKRKYTYYPGATINKFGRGFGRLFISSKQKIQSLNLGGFFAYSPYQVSFTPGLSSHGLYSGQVINHVSLNVMGGYTAGVQGVELGGAFNIDRNDVTFLQAGGVFNMVGGSVRGIQLAGIFNTVFTDMKGIQAAGAVNKVSDMASGIQMAGLTNIAGHLDGVQIGGLYNKTDRYATGVQAAGIANLSTGFKGLQVAGLFNKAEGQTGTQVSAGVNIAKKVKGLQFAGLVNIADSSDYSIALFNFIKNGSKSISLSEDELLYTTINFRSGGKRLYGLIGVGYKLGDAQKKYAADLGLGIHLIDHRYFSLDAEYVAEILSDFRKAPDNVSIIRILPAFKISSHMSLYAGPGLGFASHDLDDPGLLKVWHLYQHTNSTTADQLTVGISGGIQFTW